MHSGFDSFVRQIPFNINRFTRFLVSTIQIKQRNRENERKNHEFFFLETYQDQTCSNIFFFFSTRIHFSPYSDCIMVYYYNSFFTEIYFTKSLTFKIRPNNAFSGYDILSSDFRVKSI